MVAQERIRQILSLAVFSPSGDNCQPWQYRLEEGVVSVFHDSARAKHSLNTPPLASVIALGALVETVALLSQNRGLGIQVENIFSPADLFREEAWHYRGPWIRLKFFEGAVRDVRSDEANVETWQDSEILNRCTDRRAFHGVKSPDIAEIIRQSGYSGKVKFNWHLLESESERTALARSEASIMRTYEIVRDTAKWVRLRRKHAEESQDGFSSKNLGQSLFETWLFVLAGRIPFVLKACGGLFRLTYQLKVYGLLKNSGVISLALSQVTVPELVQAGRAALRLWLRLEKAGYGVHPLTFSSLFSWMISKACTSWRPDSKTSIEAACARSVLQSDQENGWEVVWALRVGLIESPLPRSWRTSRRQPIYLED